MAFLQDHLFFTINNLASMEEVIKLIVRETPGPKTKSRQRKNSSRNSE
jgi:hypothetical protein